MGDAFERGLILYRQRRYRLAGDEFRRELAIDHRFAPAHAMLGLSLLGAGDLAGAKAEVGEAIRLAPDEAHGHYALAHLSLRSGLGLNFAPGPFGFGNRTGAVRKRLVRAREQLAHALQLAPTEAIFLAFAAEVECNLGKWSAATRLAREGLRCRPDDVGCSLILARALVANGFRGEAERLLRRVLANDAEQANAHLMLGRLLLEKGDWVAANKRIKEALRLDPTSKAGKTAMEHVMWGQFPPCRLILRIGSGHQTSAGKAYLTFVCATVGIGFGFLRTPTEGGRWLIASLLITLAIWTIWRLYWHIAKSSLTRRRNVETP